MNIKALANQIKNECVKAYPGVKFSVRQVASSTHYGIDVTFSADIDRLNVDRIANYYAKLYDVYVSTSRVKAVAA